MNPIETVHARRWWTLAVLCFSLVVITLDNTILNVAIPTLQRELHATNSQLQWMVDSYTLVFAGLLLTAGSLGDRFGRRGALQIGLLVFGIGSVGYLLGGLETVLVGQILPQSPNAVEPLRWGLVLNFAVGLVGAIPLLWLRETPRTAQQR